MALLPAAAADSVTETFQKALFEEEANQNYDAAMRAYREVVGQMDQQRKLAATAVFRLGECYRKLGQTNEAAVQYQRIVRDFPDQPTLVNLSRQNLAGLGASPASIAGTSSAQLAGAASRTAELDSLKEQHHRAREEYERLDHLLTEIKKQSDAELKKTLPMLQPDPTLAKLLEQDSTARQKRTELEQQFAANHPAVKAVDAVIKLIGEQVADRLKGILGSLEIQRALAAKRMDQLQKQFNEMRDQAVIEAGMTPALSQAARLEQKRLLEEEIKLAEQQLASTNQQVEVGRAPSSEVIAKEREILGLRRQLAGLDLGPATASPAGSAETGATDEEDKEIRRIQALIQNSPDLISGTGAGSAPTPLMVAASKGHLAVARFLLAAKAEVNAQRDGVTALHNAALAGQKSMTELLLTNGANANVQDKTGKSPLFTAAVKGFRSVAEVLLNNKADVDLKDNIGRTALFAAAEAGQPELVDLLVRHGSDVNAQDQAGMTPLHLAASTGQAAAVERLLAHKAMVDAKTKSGVTPLGLAAEQRQAKTAGLLLKAGADARVKVGDIPLLHLAINRDQIEILKQLLALKLDLEVTDSSGLTPLQLAVTRYNYSGADVPVRLLLEAGADPNRPFNAIGNSRFVPGGGMPSMDTTGCTPLVVASFLGNIAMMKDLLAHGAKVDAKSVEGWTPLLYAVQKKSMPMLEAILAHKPDLEARPRSGFPALAVAIDSGESRIAEKLIQAGADVNAELPENVRSTLLHFAVVNRNKDMVELLATNKASLNVLNKLGETPLDFARSQGRSAQQTREREDFAEIAAVLLKHGADEKFTQRSKIMVGRGAGGVGSRVFTRGTNDWNRYTLVELIATAFANPMMSSLLFPDLSRVTIERLGTKSEPARTISVDVAELLNAGACTNAPWLEWGDWVDLPERDHPVNESWQGLTEPVRAALIKCLQREVNIVIKGQSRKVILTPRFQLPGYVMQPMAITSDPGFPPGASVPEAGSEKAPIRLGVFRLNEVLNGSGLLRTSSDLSRVRVKRSDPITGKPVEWIVNLTRESPDERNAVPQAPGIPVRSIRPATDAGVDSDTGLWLRDGDEIEVPDK